MAIKTNGNSNLALSKNLILVSGGCKSGKSRWAEYLISEEPNVLYIATGLHDYNDTEWEERIKEHKRRRPNHWKVIEIKGELTELINQNKEEILLIDSLGGFVTANLDMHEKDWKEHINQLIEALINHEKTVIIVSEQTGWGVVPETKIGNTFRDRLCRLSEEIEVICKYSWLVIQGRAIDLKQISIRVP